MLCLFTINLKDCSSKGKFKCDGRYIFQFGRGSLKLVDSDISFAPNWHLEGIFHSKVVSVAFQECNEMEQAHLKLLDSRYSITITKDGVWKLFVHENFQGEKKKYRVDKIAFQ